MSQLVLARDSVPETSTSFVVVNPRPLLTSDLLLHMDQSTGFRDSSTRNHSITVNGDAFIDTAQFVFGDASGNFGFTTVGSLTNINGDGSLSFHTNDFTIDFRIRWFSTSGNQHIVSENDNTPFFIIGKTGAQNMYYAMSPGGFNITGTTGIVIDTWYHIAVTRQAGNVRLFVNGTQEGITFVEGTTDATNNLGAGYNYAGTNFTIGDGGLGFDIHGWLDEFRAINGYAAWTSNFTPPTAPYTI